ncbi:MAG: hypothetical protein AAFO69_07425 [Bacteroidota bacterium]
MKKIFLLLFCFLLWQFCLAQLDSAKVYVESKVAVGTKGYLPQWIGYNQNGLLNPNENDYFLRTRASLPVWKKGKFSITSGLDAVLKPHDLDDSFINQAYTEFKFGAFSLKSGRYLWTETDFNHELSSGNMYRSINTRPNWRFGAGIYQFTDVPFTKGYVQVKGMIEYGYLEDSRPVSSAKLHDKFAYIRSAKLPINLIVGLNHSAIFDGVNDRGRELPGDFLEVFFARSAVDSGNNSDSTNAAGAHFGLFEIAFEVPMKEGSIKAYVHQPISDKSGFSSNFTHNKDYVFGLEFQVKNHPFFQSLLYENINTVHQSGEGIHAPVINGRTYSLGELRALDNYDQFVQDNLGITTSNLTWSEFRDLLQREVNNGYGFSGRDDHYNNRQYFNGSSYQNLQLGNPLFTTRDRLLRTIGEDGNFDRFFINNRIIAHHIGVKGSLKQTDFRFLATFTQNFGTYGGFYGGNKSSFNEDLDYIFRQILSQQSVLIEISRKVNTKLSYTLSVGADFGDFGNNVGASGTIVYQIK